MEADMVSNKRGDEIIRVIIATLISRRNLERKVNNLLGDDENSPLTLMFVPLAAAVKASGKSCFSV